MHSDERLVLAQADSRHDARDLYSLRPEPSCIGQILLAGVSTLGLTCIDNRVGKRRSAPTLGAKKPCLFTTTACSTQCESPLRIRV
jgi:hypothetical protein